MGKEDVIPPEVLNILHCRHKQTEPQPQVANTENFVKFGHGFLRYERERHTGMLIAIPVLFRIATVTY